MSADDGEPANKRARASESDELLEAAPDRMMSLVRALHAEAGPDSMTALHTLTTLLTNVLEHPDLPKYRSVRLGNPSFHRRVGRFAAALALLRAAGFESATEGEAGSEEVTHLALPVCDAPRLARCVVLLEAAKQATLMVDEEGGGGAMSSATGGASSSGGAGSGSGSGGMSKAEGKRPMGAAQAAAADAGAAGVADGDCGRRARTLSALMAEAEADVARMAEEECREAAEAAAAAAAAAEAEAEAAEVTVGDDGNLDVCSICGLGGLLICCDGCPAAVHTACLTDGTAPDEDDEDAAWFCAACRQALEMP